MTTVDVFAPAKINLTLHVTGQRDDGYHLLDSLVAFADVGDRLSLAEADSWSISVHGPEAAGVPADENNLALKAAKLAADGSAAASITLEKLLPSASGIGGGSSDAAAALRGMHRLAGHAGSVLHAQAHDGDPILGLGADVPMCLAPDPKRVRGIGEDLEHLCLPTLAAVLINPRIEVGTPVIFRALQQKQNAPMPSDLPGFDKPEGLIEWLRGQRNDLEGPAVQIAPGIANVLAALRNSEHCALARMSGSGATCFGLFQTANQAKAAAEQLTAHHADWWIKPCLIGDQTAQSMPVIS